MNAKDRGDVHREDLTLRQKMAHAVQQVRRPIEGVSMDQRDLLQGHQVTEQADEPFDRGLGRAHLLGRRVPVVHQEQRLHLQPTADGGHRPVHPAAAAEELERVERGRHVGARALLLQQGDDLINGAALGRRVRRRQDEKARPQAELSPPGWPSASPPAQVLYVSGAETAAQAKGWSLSLTQLAALLRHRISDFMAELSTPYAYTPNNSKTFPVDPPRSHKSLPGRRSKQRCPVRPAYDFQTFDGLSEQAVLLHSRRFQAIPGNLTLLQYLVQIHTCILGH